ncbi:hypothetical protein T484DRAFT_1919479, partial [Baffinella frigidus]
AGYWRRGDALGTVLALRAAAQGVVRHRLRPVGIQLQLLQRRYQVLPGLQHEGPLGAHHGVYVVRQEDKRGLGRRGAPLLCAAGRCAVGAAL